MTNAAQETRSIEDNSFELLLASNRAEIKGHASSRIVKCPYCGRWFRRTVTRHLRTAHPKKWDQWTRDMLDLFNEGFSPKQIMNMCHLLFTWRLIEKEIIKASEEYGIPIAPRFGSSVKKWHPDPIKNEDRIERTTVWSFPKRGDWAVHKGDYKGNWPPQIPFNLIKQYTKKNEIVLDSFVGGGTTLIECWRLGRQGIGVDISPHALSFTKKRLADMAIFAQEEDIALPRNEPILIKGDARNLRFLRDEKVDLVCGQPPYLDSQSYSFKQLGDLSRISDPTMFLNEMEKVARELFRVLKKGKRCAILMGDVRKKGKLILLSHGVESVFEEVGFEIEENIVKIQHKDKSTIFYIRQQPRSLRYRIAHEYLYVFRRPR